MTGAAAVFLAHDGAVGICSGILVGPRAVLTARHCLADRDDFTVRVRFGADVRGERSAPAVIGRELHPDRDLALLRLDADAPEASLRWAATPSSSSGAFEAASLGFAGEDGSARLCTRTATAMRMDGLRRDGPSVGFDGPIMQTSAVPSVCHGDSGAGVVATVDGEPLLVGVTIGSVGGQPGDPPDAKCSRVGVVAALDDADEWLVQRIGRAAVALEVSCVEPGLRSSKPKCVLTRRAP